MGMGHISTKDNSWYVTDKGDSPCQSINKYRIPSPSLKSTITVRDELVLKSKIRRVSAITNLHVYFQGNICKILLLVRLENMFSQTALGDQSKISLTDPFEIP